MPFVLDASVAMAWAFPDENHPVATIALDRINSPDEARVPSIWWYEVRNSIITNERRRRLTEADTSEYLRRLSRLPISIEHPPDEVRVMALSRRYKLTVYDAAYLELAQREAIPLATLDNELVRAARAEKVHLVGKSSN
jgi:predicted nucleic acid-binding protein